MMRAKMRVSGVEMVNDSQMELKLSAVVSGEEFGPDGESENNTYSRWTPTAELTMTITNPDLFGKFTADQEFYLDFTAAE
jgi:hypothetical protein